jgi:hypothetical protein
MGTKMNVKSMEEGQGNCESVQPRQLVCTEGVRVRSGIAAGDTVDAAAGPGVYVIRIDARASTGDEWVPAGMAFIDR